MTLRRRVYVDGDSTNTGALLMHDIDTNSSEVGSLKRAASLQGCCCSDNASLFVELKLCPNCVAETQCGCGGTYDYRAGKGSDSNDTGCGSVDPDTSEFECSGRSIGGSNCTSCADIDCGAVYIRRDAFFSVVFAEDSSGNPYYFDTLPTANNYYDSSTGNLRALPTPYVGVKIRLTLNSGKQVVTAATITDLKAPFSDVNNCNIIDGIDGLFVRDCAGNIPLYGSGGSGVNVLASIGGASGTVSSGEALCKAICEHRFYLDSVECDQSCGSCNLPGNISNVYNFHSAEFALGKYHLGCSSCSGCNPAKASNKAVNTTASTTHCLGNKAYFLDPENSVQDVDPFNVVAGNSSYNNNSRCGKEFDGDAFVSTNDCGGNPSGDIQGPFAHHVAMSGPFPNRFGGIDCSITCSGSAQNSPFVDCAKATSDGLTDCAVLGCDCCCDPNTQNPNSATTYTITFPDLSLSGGSSNPISRSLYCCAEGVSNCFNSPSASNPCSDPGPGPTGSIVPGVDTDICANIGTLKGGNYTVQSFGACQWIGTQNPGPSNGTYTNMGVDVCAGNTCPDGETTGTPRTCDPDFHNCLGTFHFRIDAANIICFPGGKFNLFASYSISNDVTFLGAVICQYEKDVASPNPAGTYTSVSTGTSICGVNLATLTCTVS